MLLCAWFLWVLGWNVFGIWSSFLWRFVLGSWVFINVSIIPAMAIILIIIVLLLSIKHGKLGSLLILWDTMRNWCLLRFRIKFLFWPLQYLILFLHIFSALLMLFLFSLLLLLILLHKLVYLYHVPLSHLVYLKRLFGLAHVLYGLVFFSWLFLWPQDLLYPRVLEWNDVFWRTSHFLQLLATLLSWTLFGAWVWAGLKFCLFFLRIEVVIGLFGLLHGVLVLVQVVLCLL